MINASIKYIRKHALREGEVEHKELAKEDRVRRKIDSQGKDVIGDGLESGN